MPNIYHDDELKSGAACSDGPSGGTGAALTPGLSANPRDKAMTALGEVATGHSTAHARILGDYIGHLEAQLDIAALRLSEASRPTWVPVGERFPAADQHVLALTKEGARLRAMWCPRWTVQSSSDDHDNYEYSEDADDYFLNEGWYETNRFEETHWQIDDPVTHWMPLPEAPK